MAPHRPAHGRSGMGSSSSAGSSSASPASAADAEAAAAHAGFINLGNTCFLNSVLQAASVTTALRTLYHPPQQAGSSSSAAAELLGVPSAAAAAGSAAHLLDAAQRARSPVLSLVDEEKGRQAPPPPRFAAPAPLAALDDAGEPSASTSATATPRPAATPSASYIAPSTHVPSAADVPLNTAFRHTLEQTWPAANSNRHRRGGKVPAVNAKPLLGALIRKYSHYGDYGQQDGHELLVHLLDAMRMEELDLIKKLQPAPPSARRRARPLRAAPLALAAQLEEEAHTPRATARADPLHALAAPPEEPKMRPFVDAVFGGKLLSAVVCEGCRHVSHTYEDFLDVSLPVRPEADTKGVKQRHSIRKMADRWRRGQKPPARPRSAAETAQALQRLEDGQMSEAEPDSTPALLRGFSIARPKSAMPRPKAGISPAPSPHINGAGPTASEVEQMRKLLARGGGSDTDVESAAEGSSSSARVPDAAVMSLAPDFAAYSDAERAFASKHHAPPASSSGGLLRAVSGRMGGKSSEPPSRVSSPNPPSEAESASGARGGEPMKRSPSNRQGAYITRLFADVPRAEAPSGSAGFLWPRWAGTTAAAPAPSETHLATRSRGNSATQADVLAAQAGTGLVKSLMQFTAVEALDGENRYACKRCWRLANPLTPAERARQLRRRARRGEDDAESEKSEDDEEDSDAGEEEEQHGVKVAVPTPIVANGTDTIKATHLPPPVVDARRGSASSLGETSGEDELQSITRSMPIPIIETSPATPAVATASPRWPGADGSLRAPQAIPGSLRTIAKTSTTGSEYATSDEESGDALTGSETEASTGRGTDSASDRGAPVDALRTLRVSSGAPRRRRSTQSIAQRALKRYLIASTPPVLVFHFKRFQHVNRTYGFSSFAGGSKKIDDAVSFPEVLDIAPFVAPPREEYDRAGMLKASSDERALKKAAMLGGEVEEKRQKESHHRWHWRGRPEAKPASTFDGDAPSTRYRLYAVVMHQGTMSSGHYTAFVLAPPAPSSSFSATPAAASSDSRRPSVPSSPALGATSDAGSASIKSASSASAGGAPAADGTEAPRTLQPSSSEGTMASTTSSSSSSVRSGAEAATPATSASSAATPAAAAPSAVPDQRHWLFTSDSLVRAASIDEVLKTKHAYLLFYENVPTDA